MAFSYIDSNGNILGPGSPSGVISSSGPPSSVLSPFDTEGEIESLNKLIGVQPQVTPNGSNLVLATPSSPGAMSASAYAKTARLAVPSVQPPSVGPTATAGASGNLTGTYYYYVSFVTAVGETGPSPYDYTIPGVTVTAKQIGLSAIPVSSDASVTARKIYRSKGTQPADVFVFGTVDDDQPFAFFLTTIADNTTTVYTDNIADAGLGAAMPCRNTTDNVAGITPNAEISRNITVVGEGAGGPALNAHRYSAFGKNAGANATIFFGCTFVGEEAGMNNGGTDGGDDNSFFGNRSGKMNTTGLDNAFFGQDSGANNTTGSMNTFLGEECGKNSTTANECSFVGESCGCNNGTNDRNTYMGFQAGGRTTGSTVTDNALFGRTTGTKLASAENSMFGSQAGPNTTSGGKNCFFGFGVGYGNTVGDMNCWFGHPNAVDMTTNWTNTSCFGFDVKPTKNNQVTLGNTSVVETLLRGCVGIGTSAPSSSYAMTIDDQGHTNTIVRWDRAGVDFGYIGSANVLFAGAASNELAVYCNNKLKFGNNGIMAMTISDGNVGIGATTSPAARLHLPAGTATAGTAPIRLTSGTLLTSAVDGTIEYDGVHFWGTIGTTRKQLDN